jgi:hypothetical protein
MSFLNIKVTHLTAQMTGNSHFGSEIAWTAPDDLPPPDLDVRKRISYISQHKAKIGPKKGDKKTWS